ncbi:gephyrin-like molybdotransferase Glp [Pyruvatibacter mobilis]|uniref:molybdopterin molybdotransferase MoeA n=1 Tax=Pyruvatibacter mobilis TaxID=1712261 RepID=UPI003BB0E2B5
MITVEEARELIAASLSPLDAETVAAARAFGRTLSAAITATRDQPPSDVSAMDGYAVRSQDLDGTPLEVRGESRAGTGHDAPLAPRQAVRVSTGARMPAGADQVVIQENVTIEGTALHTAEAPNQWRHVRKAGSDYRAGEQLLEPGTILNPAKVSLAAAAGIGDIPVMRRPRVAILSTGDELVMPGETPGPDQIFNSGTPGLSALVFSVGGQPLSLGIAEDDPEDVREALASADGADLLVTIGGASVGDHDHLRRVFTEEGGTLIFEKVRVKPGKPAWFGKLGELPVLGLPGNPVSAMVTARLFLVPAMRTLLGQPSALALGFEQAVLGAPLEANGDRETYVRGVRDHQTGPVRALSKQDSAHLAALANATVLIRRLPDAPAVDAGQTVEVLPL